MAGCQGGTHAHRRCLLAASSRVSSNNDSSSSRHYRGNVVGQVQAYLLACSNTGSGCHDTSYSACAVSIPKAASLMLCLCHASICPHQQCKAHRFPLPLLCYDETQLVVCCRPLPLSQVGNCQSPVPLPSVLPLPQQAVKVQPGQQKGRLLRLFAAHRHCWSTPRGEATCAQPQTACVAGVL